MTDNPRIRLLGQITVYYGFCLASIVYLALAHQEWLRFLPFGGLDALKGDPVITADRDTLEQMLATTPPGSVLEDGANLLFALAGCIVVMIPIRWVYMSDAVMKSYKGSVATSLLVLPLLVTALVYVVKYSLPLAFALTGIFAGVRYRTSLKSPYDAFFTFACIAVGLSAGIRSLGIGLIMAIAFTMTMIAASPGRGDPKAEDV